MSEFEDKVESLMDRISDILECDMGMLNDDFLLTGVERDFTGVLDLVGLGHKSGEVKMHHFIGGGQMCNSSPIQTLLKIESVDDLLVSTCTHYPEYSDEECDATCVVTVLSNTPENLQALKDRHCQTVLDWIAPDYQMMLKNSPASIKKLLVEGMGASSPKPDYDDGPSAP